MHQSPCRPINSKLFEIHNHFYNLLNYIFGSVDSNKTHIQSIMELYPAYISTDGDG